MRASPIWTQSAREELANSVSPWNRFGCSAHRRADFASGSVSTTEFGIFIGTIIFTAQ